MNMDVPSLMQITCYLRIFRNKESGAQGNICKCSDPPDGMNMVQRPKAAMLKLFEYQKTEMYEDLLFWIERQPKLELACDVAVCSLVHQHRQYVLQNGRCHLGLEHDVLYLAARLAIKFRLRRRRTIIELLGDIYRCEGCFDRIFLGAIDGPSRSHAEWFTNRQQFVRALRLFLDHSSKAGMQFFHHGEFLRMVDVPLSRGESAIDLAEQAWKGRAMDVHKLLKKYKAIVN